MEVLKQNLFIRNLIGLQPNIGLCARPNNPTQLAVNSLLFLPFPFTSAKAPSHYKYRIYPRFRGNCLCISASMAISCLSEAFRKLKRRRIFSDPAGEFLYSVSFPEYFKDIASTGRKLLP